MKKLHRVLFISVASIGFLSSSLPALFNTEKAVAQSQFDCFMIDETGQYTDLSAICDASKRIRSNGSQRAVSDEGIVNDEGNLANANATNNIPIQVINDSFPSRYVTRIRRNSATFRARDTLRSDFIDRENAGAFNDFRILGPISDPYYIGRPTSFRGKPYVIYRYLK